MATATLSSKNQITLPVDMVRALGLKAGDKLDIELIDDRLVMWPKPQRYADYFLGSLRGVWGNSVEEIDRYVAEERAGWSTGNDLEGLEILLSGTEPVSEAARQIARGLLARTRRRASSYDVANMVRYDSTLTHRVREQALNALIASGAVRRIPDPDPKRGPSRDEYLLLQRAVPLIRETLTSP